jgi:hypothetical protein
MLFAHLARRKDPLEWTLSAVDGPDDPTVPRGFEPVADALLNQGDVEAAAVETGRDLAADGVPLDELLTDLAATYAAAGLGGPDFPVVRALCRSWTEVSLRYLHGLSCDDPLTGLASLPHLRSRLGEVYRDAERGGAEVPAERALVIAETDQVTSPGDGDGVTGPGFVPEAVARRFDAALRMAEVADGLRSVFSGGETVARAGVHRAVALVRREADLAAQVESLRVLLESRSAAGPDGVGHRVWIEALPGSHESASLLLDELAR